MNALFVSPHPDDVEFACLGTILKHRDMNDTIIIMVASECTDLPRNKTLLEESKKVMKIIKPKEDIRLDLPNRRIYDTPNREILREALEKVRDTTKIDIVYCPWLSDINQDHSSTAEEVVRVFRYCSLVQYEITHSCPGFEPDYYVEITEEQIDKKLKIIEIFKSQLERSYSSRGYIKSIMLFRGLESGFKYAEAFNVWRIRRSADE
jgi:LmbE family N-acetylglucosaminyl deacetylase